MSPAVVVHQGQVPPVSSATREQPKPTHSFDTPCTFIPLTNRPPSPASHELQVYSFGVEAQTIPLSALGKDGKIKPERFIGIQKDTSHQTIYYLSNSDYERVYRAYHRSASSLVANNDVLSDSFFISNRQISVIRLPDQGPRHSSVDRQQSILLSPDEKRYVDALTLFEHSRARGSSDYHALCEFYRGNKSDSRTTFDPLVLEHIPKPAEQCIHNEVMISCIVWNRNGQLSDNQFGKIIQEMHSEVSEETILHALDHAAQKGCGKDEIDRVLGYALARRVAQPSDHSLTFQSAKAEARRRKPHAAERVEEARAVGFDNASLEVQRTRVAPLLERESVLSEIADNAPIPLIEARWTRSVDRKSYAQVTAQESDRLLALADGRTVKVHLQLRYHSRTQMAEPELPGYRASLSFRGNNYELTDVPVIQAGEMPPSRVAAHVVLDNGFSTMYVHGNPLRGSRAPDMLVTDDGLVFTRQGLTRAPGGKDIRVVVNTRGNPITIEQSDVLKNLWHIPYVPIAMDVVGRD